ncbi:MAG: MoxR family ATPase [Clostridia bacterium]|nr:MoxR family ATPase [Clostridia bacterium]MBQ7304689.1 MoxR family ATPase [Clostridia bacterium]MBQ7845032.1 MoxR family ATPase [Clostridia bacterium]MBQ7865656.1 MoxR family ATPase [Clostridia bacterium]MBQ8312398.1 MoxR family ATPase [Clostridia bacterium]
MQPRRIIQALQENISKVIVGKEEAIEYALIALLCKGHVLIEDVPGVGKTTLASALAKSLDCSFRRIQFTPDLMPSDVTGFTLVNFKTGEMEYKEGAVMSQVILADEINRTSPKTQSALLEVMEEQQVTVDGITHKLPQPFIVLATQNPGEFVGTYPLPEAQMDRFFLRIAMGYPTIEQEMDVLERYSGTVKPMAVLEPVCAAEDIIALQQMVTTIYCSPEVRSYVATLAAATRQDPALTLGASTRAAIALIHGAQACALLDGRDFILPEDVQHMALPVLSHRVVLNPEARMKGVTAEQVLVKILKNVAVPVKL